MLSLATPLLAFAAVAAAQDAAAGSQNRGPVYPNCARVVFSTTVTANNFAFGMNVSDISQLNQTILQQNYTTGPPVTATTKIVGRYCEPEVKNANNNKLEFLLHSITNNKDLWSGLGEPGKGYKGDEYSWIAYASKQGYPTLSLDRLGNGESDHPDPILVVQGPFEYRLYHAIIEQIKSGNGSPLPRTFSAIAGIGNSYGSCILSNMAFLFPNDFSDVILTGYTSAILSSFPGIIAVVPLPAALADNTRFGGLSLGYVTTTSPVGRRDAFYNQPAYVDYEDEIVQLDIAVRDVVSLGQFLSNYLDGAKVADKYTGRALVLTGEEDDAFCGPGTSLLELLGPVKCGNKIPDTKALFPVADYNWYAIDRTGHSNMLHKSKDVSFKVAHDFLSGAKFAKTGGA